MTKTLGQVAHDAARAANTLMLDTLAPWERQPKHVRDGWQAAAEAVAREVSPAGVTEWVSKHIAVIQAAEAWYHSTQTDGSYPTVALEKAVEALQEVGGE